VIVAAVRWYLRVEVDHDIIDRWVQRFTPLLAEAAYRAGIPSAVA
jgi:transposase-like protein